MLPSFRIVIGAVFLCAILFAMSGAGVVMPETRTRFGEVPEVGRPMMTRIIADEPAQAQFRRLNMARRAEQLEELRARTVLELAAQGAPAADTAVVVAANVAAENPDHGAVAAPIAAGAIPNLGEPLALRPDGALGSALPGNPIVTAMPAAPVAPAVVRDDDPTVEAAVAELEPAAPGEPPTIGAVWLPRVRPIETSPAPRRAVHRVRHFGHFRGARRRFGTFESYQPYQSYQFNQFSQSR
jgi:hypothetical protein